MKNKQLISAVRFKIASLKQALNYAGDLKLTNGQIDQLLDQLMDLKDLLRILESENQ